MEKIKVIHRNKKGKILLEEEIYVPKYEYHEYDVNIIRNCKELSKLIDSPGILIKEAINKEEYKNHLREGVKYFCENNKLKFKQFFDGDLPIVLPSTHPLYEIELAYTLIMTDENKISQLLEYQNEKYCGNHNGNEDFTGLIEFSVYKLVKIHSPLVDNGKRLEKIMHWVDNKKIQQTQLNSGNKTPKEPETFPEFLKIKNNDDRIAFAEKIKEEFIGSIGIDIALMLAALEKLELLVITTRNKKYLYIAVRKYFGHSIGTDESINRPLRIVRTKKETEPKVDSTMTMILKTSF